jgi:RNA polymerase subunit RPABC4/transcription elongation factor Spt4
VAKTVCLKCDMCYTDCDSICPHCGTQNYFADQDGRVVLEAVKVLAEQANADHEKQRHVKLAELRRLRPQHRYIRWSLRFLSNVAYFLFLPLLSQGNRFPRR